jgi:hypothetical protein
MWTNLINYVIVFAKCDQNGTLMKTKVLSFQSVLVVFAMFSIPQPFVYAGEGGESGGGGNAYAAHFAAVGNRINRALRMICSTEDPKHRVFCDFSSKFSEATAGSQVIPVTSLKGRNETQRDAGPDGKGNILLNVPIYQSRLAESPVNFAAVAQLVAHEYLILSDAETMDSYEVSSQLINAFRSELIDLSSLVGELPKNARKIFVAPGRSACSLPIVYQADAEVCVRQHEYAQERAEDAAMAACIQAGAKDCKVAHLRALDCYKTSKQFTCDAEATVTGRL